MSIFLEPSIEQGAAFAFWARSSAFTPFTISQRKGLAIALVNTDQPMTTNKPGISI
ncbi:MAG TPA: hypothetical protein V6D50_19855 [Chroococcales cyanobacterium]